MKALLIFAVAVASLAAFASASSPPAEAAPLFNIDLDAPPQDRYDELVPLYKDKFGPVLQYLNSLIPPEIQKYLDPIMAALDQVFPHDYADELRGISAKSGVDLGQLVILNLVYEFTVYCTSIVAQDPKGFIYHSRNLDYDIPGLQNLTIQVNFQKNNETIYSCTTFAGYMGCLTGMRPGGWAVTVNERDQGTGPLDNLIALLEGGKSIGFFLRSTLQNVDSFSTAFAKITETVLISPVYLTLSGTKAGEGAIVTRNRTIADDIWMIDSDAGAWWRLETNDDHWKPAQDQRRAVANAGMANIGQSNIANDRLYQVLSTPPVFNSETMYTAQMVPATGEYTSMIRWDRPTHVANPHPSVVISNWIKRKQEAERLVEAEGLLDLIV